MACGDDRVFPSDFVCAGGGIPRTRSSSAQAVSAGLDAATIDKDLLYAATARCGRCGDGLAHPIDHVRTMAMRAWVCSRALKSGDVSGQHDRFDFALYKIREETSINNTGSHTTRPAGTVARTLGKATCPQCNHTWQSEPYNACGLGHHWFSGPCPNCGYAVGGAGTSSTRDGARIDHRFYVVVLDDLHGAS